VGQNLLSSKKVGSHQGEERALMVRLKVGGKRKTGICREVVWEKTGGESLCDFQAKEKFDAIKRKRGG